MDETGFRRFLKRSGKKETVIDSLVRHVLDFEIFLQETGREELENATEQDLEEYLHRLAERELKARMRGLNLYFGFTGKPDLARCAGQAREQSLAKTRKSFPLRDFRGIRPSDIARLEEIGVVTVEDMLEAGRTPDLRRHLALQTGVLPQTILELVKLADLSRLGAVKSVRARLYYDAGLDIPERFVQWSPGALRQYLVTWVERTGFDGIAPLPKEIQNAIAKARTLPKVVEYDP